MRRLRDRGGPEGTRYTMREKMFSVGDDFWIETEGGERVFKVNGKAVRVRDTLVLESRSGEELFTIQEKKQRPHDHRAAAPQGGFDATRVRDTPALTCPEPAPNRRKVRTTIEEELLRRISAICRVFDAKT